DDGATSGSSSLNPSTSVIVAANRLPVRVTRGADGQWSVEWAGDRVIEAQNALSHHELARPAGVKFVGRVAEIAVPPDEQRALAQELQAFNCFPVFVSAPEAKLYYEDYCKQTLWPTFHNVVDVYSPVDVVLDADGEQRDSAVWNPDSQKLAWQAYANVNQLFAQVPHHRICELYEPGDVVWVQDYHLLLTPSYIIRKVRGANVGLFLHVPFPSSEVFRTLSARKELLRGMLNADHIGFHLFECRILGLTYHPILRGQLGIEYGGRRVAVTCSHMAIDAERVEATLAEPSVRETIVALRQKYTGKRIIAGCDTIERLKGVPCKLFAFDAFLERCPDFVGKVVLVEKGIHRRGRATDYMQSKKEIERLVEGINRKYRERARGNVIDYEEVAEFAFKDRIALWRVADVQLTTVLRDGLNTTPFEFIVTHNEFSGSSRLLSGAITVNPWELDQVIDGLRGAMYMSPKEREHRRDCDFQFVSSNPPRRWAKCVLTDIVSARKREDTYVYMGTGFGLDFRVMEVSADFRKLTDQEVVPAYRTSKARAIFVDYYRTLAPDVSKVMGVRWPDVSLNALSTLEHLCKDPRNMVFIVSGCNCDLLMQKFGGVPGLGLVAEHGYFIRRAPLGNDARIGQPWERHGDGLHSETTSRAWRSKAEKVIEMYVDRTNGSSLELRKSAVLFRYGKSDFEFGALQAAELKEHLEGVFQGWPLDIIQGKDYIEVRPEGVGKGKVIERILGKMRVDGNPADFVLCLGDDVADELMFETLNAMVASAELPRGKVFTCTVGQKPSKAEFFVDDYTDVIALLKSLKVVSTKSNRNYSLSDMQSFMKDAQQSSMLSGSVDAPGFTRNANSDSSFRRTSSRYALHNPLQPVIEEDQSTANGDSSTPFAGARRRGQRKRRTPWYARVQQIAVLALVALILRWRRGVTSAREKKLLMYLVASIGLAWSVRKIRSKAEH
ncbi:hypothetical protein PybrP1_005938, partial [[Pythium] brassicae (nom. inval.)]